MEVSGTSGGTSQGRGRERGEGPSSSGGGLSSSHRLGAPVLCLLRLAQQGRHKDALLLSQISVLVG